MCSKAVATFSRDSSIRLLGALLREQSDEWAVQWALHDPKAIAPLSGEPLFSAANAGGRGERRKPYHDA